ncbi:Ger(x)C family spore germination protein [Aneurinibacillus danicus]|uniref:Uncharacterized protein n=1 Tax=Aneurinibacillus danicus TaxID=267746 RepID=A0A511V382_9BACL|nr:Ger(x)C family spore germination protein [Aneurinibacillus danicus]GEN33377.1 hypothetical protein ADA01nite_08370 [Aneurinibacillus danicus]
MKVGWKPLLLLVLIMLPLIQGCGTAEGGIAVRELNQLNVVMVTGVDYDPKHKKFILSIQTVKPALEKGTAVSPETVYTTRATGDTIMEASKNLRAQTSGKLIWFHGKVIILGHTLVRENVMKEVIDFFARNREIRYSSWILIAKKTAEEIVTAEPNSEVMMGYELNGIINNQSEWGRTVVVTLKDLINNYSDPYAGFVTGQVNKSKGKGGKDQIIIADGVVINAFNPKQASRVSVLSKKEIQALRIFHKMAQQEPEIIYSVSLGAKGDTKYNTAVQVKVRNRKATSTIENGRPKIKMELTLDGTVLESGTQLDLSKKETVARLEGVVEKKIIADIRLLLTRLQKKDNADIVGFASLIHRQHKDYWHQHEKQWREIYPNIPVDISIKWNSIRNGIIRQVKVGEKE